MALFEYRCDDCETTFELIRSHRETGPVKCERCESTRTRKLRAR